MAIPYLSMEGYRSIPVQLSLAHRIQKYSWPTCTLWFEGRYFKKEELFNNLSAAQSYFQAKSPAISLLKEKLDKIMEEKTEVENQITQIESSTVYQRYQEAAEPSEANPLTYKHLILSDAQAEIKAQNYDLFNMLYALKTSLSRKTDLYLRTSFRYAALKSILSFRNNKQLSELLSERDAYLQELQEEGAFL